MASGHDRFELKYGEILTVTDPNLDEQIRRLAIRAMDLGTTVEQKGSTLRCLINHCESLANGLEHRTPTPLGKAP